MNGSTQAANGEAGHVDGIQPRRHAAEETSGRSPVRAIVEPTLGPRADTLARVRAPDSPPGFRMHSNEAVDRQPQMDCRRLGGFLAYPGPLGRLVHPSEKFVEISLDPFFDVSAPDLFVFQKFNQLFSRVRFTHDIAPTLDNRDPAHRQLSPNLRRAQSPV